jgi:hypothetical protein
MFFKKGDIVIYSVSPGAFLEGKSAVVISEFGTYSISIRWLTGAWAGKSDVLPKSRFKIVVRAET